jgi:hypothetical protein
MHRLRPLDQVDFQLPGGDVEMKMLMCDESGEDPSCEWWLWQHPCLLLSSKSLAGVCLAAPG